MVVVEKGLARSAVVGWGLGFRPTGIFRMTDMER